MASSNRCDTMFNTKKFIMEIKKQPVIYDMRCQQYNDRVARTNAWYDVCQAMTPGWNSMSPEDQGLEEKNLRNKWRNIRDYFTREIKLQDMGHGLTEVTGRKRRKYSYFDQLLFLKPNLKYNNQLTELRFFDYFESRCLKIFDIKTKMVKRYVDAQRQMDEFYRPRLDRNVNGVGQQRVFLSKNKSGGSVTRIAHTKKRKFYGNQHTKRMENSRKQKNRKTSSKSRGVRETKVAIYRNNDNNNTNDTHEYKTEVETNEEIIIESNLGLEEYNSTTQLHTTGDSIAGLYQQQQSTASRIQMRYADPLCEASLVSFDNEMPDMSSRHGSPRAFAGDDDYDKMFLLSLLPSLRRLPEHMKLHVRIQMQQILAATFQPSNQ